MEYVTVQSVLFIKPHCVPIMAELLQKDILEDEELGMDQENRLAVEQMIELLEKHDFKKLKEELESVHPVDIVDALEELDKKQRILIFRLLAKEEAAEVFTDMNSDMREDLINALTDSELEEVMEEMYVDDTVDVLEEMPANVVDRLLMATDEETRKKINALLQYPEDSAGSIMNIEYISLRKEMTVADAILKIRQVGINKETIYTCYVTENLSAPVNAVTTSAAEIKKAAEGDQISGTSAEEIPVGNVVESPLVGTFYAAPAEDAESFVKVGDRVKAGQTVCILEAMKLMNEIQSDYDCEIEAVLVSNEQKVEYGQPLFRVKRL